MDILFKNKKLQTLCCDQSKRDREYGAERGKRLGKRLDQMRAAANLGEFKQVHSRCHPLKGDRKGEWSADLDGPYRLLFEPVIDKPDETQPASVALTEDEQSVNEPVKMEQAKAQAEPAKDTFLDITTITIVRILEVGVDTHE